MLHKWGICQTKKSPQERAWTLVRYFGVYSEFS
jgi:hypothetical protein